MEIKTDTVHLMLGECLARMSEIPDGSVDMILTDPPYGTTACKWDSIIPLPKMWAQLKRIIKPNGAIVMTAAQPFTTSLISSNMKQFKYTWVWEKPTATGHLNAKKQPMRAHEDLVVFYRAQAVYNPQKTHGHERKTAERRPVTGSVYGAETTGTSYDSTSRYPRSVQTFKTDKQLLSVHPTQKPVALMEYLIKTYTNAGETVLDFTMGSGTTGVACQNMGRKFIGIELDPKYFAGAVGRILNTTPEVKRWK